jgi:hypothetical protein
MITFLASTTVTFLALVGLYRLLCLALDALLNAPSWLRDRRDGRLIRGEDRETLPEHWRPSTGGTFGERVTQDLRQEGMRR